LKYYFGQILAVVCLPDSLLLISSRKVLGTAVSKKAFVCWLSSAFEKMLSLNSNWMFCASLNFVLKNSSSLLWRSPNLLHIKLCILPQINNKTKFLWPNQKTDSYCCNFYTSKYLKTLYQKSTRPPPSEIRCPIFDSGFTYVLSFTIIRTLSIVTEYSTTRFGKNLLLILSN
jgi:hypothetical protein